MASPFPGMDPYLEPKVTTSMTKYYFIGLLCGLSLALTGVWPRGLDARGEADDAPAATNTLSKKEKDAGWKLLFDGKTTEGWRQFGGKEVPDKWKVIDGTLTLQPKGGTKGGDIITVGQFDHFELILEWKISEGGNSG